MSEVENNFMKAYRIVERFHPSEVWSSLEISPAYYIEVKLLWFWVDIHNTIIALFYDDIAPWKRFYNSKEEALAIVHKLLQLKQKKNKVVWTSELEGDSK